MGFSLTDEEIANLSETDRAAYTNPYATDQQKYAIYERNKLIQTDEYKEEVMFDEERALALAARDKKIEAILVKELTKIIAETEYGKDISTKLQDECGMAIYPTGITATDEWWGNHGCEIWGLVEEVAETPGENLLTRFNDCAAANKAAGVKEFPIYADLYNEAATNETIQQLVNVVERGEFSGTRSTGPDPGTPTLQRPGSCKAEADAIEAKLLKIKELWDSLQSVNQAAVGAMSSAMDSDIEDKLLEACKGIQGCEPANVNQIAGVKAMVMARQSDHGAREIKLEDTLIPGYKKMAFKEQCFLLAKIFDLAEQKINVVEMTVPQTKKLPYYEENPDDNASLMMVGEPYGFMNRLTQHPAQSAFFNMKTEEISSLQPMIRLFKVIDGRPTDETTCGGGQEMEREFLFDAYASKGDVDSLFLDSAKRGFGVGIKNFSFTYDGSNPFSAKKSIKAKLQIFASSFDELLKDRTDKPDSPLNYKYADLALKTWTAKPEPAGPAENDASATSSVKCEKLEAIREENKNKLTFRLKAVIGWARPSGWNTGLFTTMTEDQQNNVLEAINESYVTLNLTPTTHEFDIDEMGRVNFTINYLAYVEDFFDQSQFDIFYDREVAQNEAARDYINYTLNKKKCSKADRTKFKEWLAATEIITRDKFKNTQSLINRLMGVNLQIEQRGAQSAGETTGSKIKYIELSKDEIKAFATKGPFAELDIEARIVDNPSNTFTVSQDIANAYERNLGKSDVADADRALQKANLKFALEVNNPEKETIAFFYVSDLLDVILEGIGDRLKAYGDANSWGEIPNLALTMINDAKMDPGLVNLQQFTTYAVEKVKKIKSFEKQFKKFRLLLGPLEILNPKNESAEIKLGTPPSASVNFGDVAISVKYFMEWMSEQTTAKEQSRYNLSKFLNDFFNNLLKNFLNNDTCFSFNTKQKTRLNQTAVTSYKDCTKIYDEVTQWIIENTLDASRRANINVMSEERQPRAAALNVSGPPGLPITDSGVGNEINYLVYFAGRTQPVELMNGSRSQDAQNGIFHYLIGRPRGIVKTINLSKTTAAGLKEVRFEQQGYDGLEQLREVYDVNIDCYANVKTFPGTYIYVDPRGFAPNTTSYEGGVTDLTRYGIGGYCMIIRSEHEFGPGTANTKLTAKWVAQLEHEDEVAQCKAAAETTAGDGGEKTRCDT